MNNWVPRQDENNAKNTDKINLEAETVAQQQQTNFLKQPVDDRNTGRKNMDSSDFMDDGWFMHLKKRKETIVDSSKLKISKLAAIDASSIQLGHCFSKWGQGSSGGQDKPIQPDNDTSLNILSQNRYSALLLDQSFENIITKPADGVKKKQIHAPTQDVKLHTCDNAWKASNNKKKSTDEDPEEVQTMELFKKVTGILNKLTCQKFFTFIEQVKHLNIDTEARLRGVLDLVFERAVYDHYFIVLFANFCIHIPLIKVPEAEHSGNDKKKYTNFKKILLMKLQQEFEKITDEFRNAERMEQTENAETEEMKQQLHEESAEEDRKSRHRSLGTILFIGELFKLNMLIVSILHECIRKLLHKGDDVSLECLCWLLTISGKELEAKNSKSANHKLHAMDAYFEKMQAIVDERKTTCRIRFMLQNIIELKQRNWVPRKNEHNPNSIAQIYLRDAKRLQLLQEEASRKQSINCKNTRRKIVYPFNIPAPRTKKNSLDSNNTTTVLRLTRKHKLKAISDEAGRYLTQEILSTANNDIVSSSNASTSEANLNELRQIAAQFAEQVVVVVKGPSKTPYLRPASPSSDKIPEKDAVELENSSLPQQNEYNRNCIDEICQREAQQQQEVLEQTIDYKNIGIKTVPKTNMNSIDETSTITRISDEDGRDVTQEILSTAENDTVLPSNASDSQVNSNELRQLAAQFVEQVVALFKGPSKTSSLISASHSSDKISEKNATKLEKLDFTIHNLKIEPAMEELSLDAIKAELDHLLQRKADNEEIEDWIVAHVRGKVRSQKFIRTLATSLIENTLKDANSIVSFDKKILLPRVPLLFEYLDKNIDLELQLLFALQALVNDLRHPKGLLTELFKFFYHEGILSKEAFIQWEKNNDPSEQNGKEIALKSFALFLMWIKEKEEEEEEYSLDDEI